MCKRLAVALSLCGLAASAGAQTTAGRITGTVHDPTGAVMRGARVVAANLDTGQERAAESNARGEYVLYPLPPGTYRLTARAAGFQTLTFEAVNVNVADTLVQNLKLEIGRIEQELTVTADRASRAGISVESTVTRQQIEALPLISRDFNQLVLLAAGAVSNEVGGGTDFGQVAVNGNRTYANDYLLDGIPNNNIFQGRSAAPVSVDVIKEFKVTSVVAPAEFGQAAATVSLVTQSGTNRIHGSLFEYYRGTFLQARDPFNTNAPQPFKRNQFGAALGGPVRLPGYDGRNRTFFFLNLEATREDETVTRVSSVPPDEFWAGDFSALLPRIQLRDPFLAGRPSIPGNRLDLYLNGSRIDSTALALRPLMGSPTLPGLGNNQVRFAGRWRDTDQFTARLDHALSARHNLAARFTYLHSPFYDPNLIGIAGTGKDEVNNTRNGSASWTATLGSRTVSELRIGLSHFEDSISYRSADGLPTVESLGLRGFEPRIPGVPPLPRITFSSDGFTEIKSGNSPGFGEANLSMIDDTTTLSEVLTHTRSRHVFKAGVEARSVHLDMVSYSEGRGRMNFTGSASARSGYSFSDFLMGLPSSTREVPVKAPISLRQWEFASFLQDDWRLWQRATLSLGLRHEVYQNPLEDSNRLAYFDEATGAIVSASDGGRLPSEYFLPRVVQKLSDPNGAFTFPLLSDVAAGLAPRRILDTKWHNLAPRVGLVWMIDAEARNVVRTGYGISYARYPRQYLSDTISLNPPYAAVFSYSQPSTLPNGVPAITLDAPYTDAPATSTSLTPGGLDRDFRLPYNQQWQLTFDRRLGANSMVSASYIGNRGVRLFRSVNVNAPYFDDASQTITRRFSSTFGTGSVALRTSDGNSIYHAFQLEVRRRPARGLAFQANWTWATGIDDVGTTLTNNLLDIENLGRDRAFSDYVRRHTVKANASYELPLGRGRRFLSRLPAWAEAALGGWRLSGIWQFATGRYFTPSFTGSSGIGNNRPDVVSGVSPNLPRGERTPQRWFNPDAFVVVPALDPETNTPRFGNAGRNVILGPGTDLLDANLEKKFDLGRGRALRVRLEVFNLLNHPNYGRPETNISNTSTVGTITTILGTMRKTQFGARFEF